MGAIFGSLVYMPRVPPEPAMSGDCCPVQVDEVSGVAVSKSVGKPVSKWPGYEPVEHPAITEAREELLEAECRVGRAQAITRVARKKYIDTCVLARNAHSHDRPGYSNVTGYA